MKALQQSLQEQSQDYKSGKVVVPLDIETAMKNLRVGAENCQSGQTYSIDNMVQISGGLIGTLNGRFYFNADPNGTQVQPGDGFLFNPMLMSKLRRWTAGDPRCNG